METMYGYKAHAGNLEVAMEKYGTRNVSLNTHGNQHQFQENQGKAEVHPEEITS